MPGQVYEGDYRHVSDTPSNISRLVEQFETRLEELFDILRQIQEIERFRWIDESILEQIRTRWEIACVHAVTPNALHKLIEDFSRAERQGEVNLRRWVTEHRKLACIRENICQIDLELDGKVSPTPRWILMHGLAEQRNEQARIESLLRTIETKLLSAYSPYGEAFDYYAALIKQQGNLGKNQPASDKRYYQYQ